MRAVQFSSFGGPEVLELVELDVPHPGPGQVRIAVRAVGVNPIDWKVRSGIMGGDLPRRTGIEAAGVVDELGEGVEGVEGVGGVGGVKLGDAVFGPTAGGAAEFAVLGNWARMPQSLDFTGAAALPVATETAARMLDLVGVQDGQTIVVNGASGSVGLAAVQLGQERGARVIGTASTRNHDLLRSFGAEPTTYGEGLEQRVRELAPGGVDRALDAAGGGALPALVALTGSADRVVTIV
ncbi:MAG: NADP-dependent oxidoreductase, partial [Solirubrobacteraceae bacterium]